MADIGMANGHNQSEDPQYLSYGKLQPPKKGNIDPTAWERKQRLREYRVAARREKRNRKSDEKKQRKLNATILRRMTRNPDKYNKNAGRNRERNIIAERRKIQYSAIKAVQRLAAVHDPSGSMFNVAPVTLLDDGTITSVEAMNRKKEAQARKEAIARGEEPPPAVKQQDPPAGDAHSVNPDRLKFLQNGPTKSNLSKRQMRKQAAWEPRPAPPKPIIPAGFEFPSDEEENWLSLWDLPDDELERRVTREKRRAAKARKDLRMKQKSGKAERRAARDEKRRVYRDLKQTWKVFREEERRRRKQLQAQEDEEGKRLVVAMVKKYREDAMKVAADLGFTLENVEGVKDIQPKALGMKGRTVNFEDLEITGEGPADLRSKAVQKEKPFNPKRVDLSAIADESTTQNIFGDDEVSGPRDTLSNNFVSFDEHSKTTYPANTTDHQALNFNHRLRRKLRRAVENAQIRREKLVRQAAISHCEAHSIPIPDVLQTPLHPTNKRGSRTLLTGELETAKQERVRARVELAEFNKWAKVLRRQAKEKSIEAGIRVYLELMDRIPRRVTLDKDRKTGDKGGDEGVGEMMSAADLIASWPMPDMNEGRFGEGYDEGGDSDEDEEEESHEVNDGPSRSSGDDDDDSKEDTSAEDSAERQLKGEMRGAITTTAKAKSKNKTTSKSISKNKGKASSSDADSDEDSESSEDESEEDSDENDDDSDEDMSDAS